MPDSAPGSLSALLFDPEAGFHVTLCFAVSLASYQHGNRVCYNVSTLCLHACLTDIVLA